DMCGSPVLLCLWCHSHRGGIEPHGYPHKPVPLSVPCLATRDVPRGLVDALRRVDGEGQVCDVVQGRSTCRVVDLYLPSVVPPVGGHGRFGYLGYHEDTVSLRAGPRLEPSHELFG